MGFWVLASLALVFWSRVARARCWEALFFFMISRVFLERAMVSLLRLFSNSATFAKCLAVSAIWWLRESFAIFAFSAIFLRSIAFISLRALALYARFLAIWMRRAEISFSRAADSVAISFSTFLK